MLNLSSKFCILCTVSHDLKLFKFVHTEKNIVGLSRNAKYISHLIKLDFDFPCTNLLIFEGCNLTKVQNLEIWVAGLGLPLV